MTVEPATIVLLVAAGYLALSLLVGSLPGRGASATSEGWVAGDRSIGLLVMYFLTGATIFSAFSFLGLPGWAYSRGAAAYAILAYGTLGMVPFYFLGPRALRLGRAYGFVTQAEMVAARFRRRSLALAMALVSALAFVPYLALQMKGAGYVLESMTRGRVPEPAGAAIVYGVVTIYVLRSGVLGVGWTNTLQGIFMLGLAWGLGLYLPTLLHGGVAEMFDRLESERPELLALPGRAGDGPWSFGEYSSWVLVSMLGFSFWPHLFMKAFTARDERTLRRTVAIYPTFQLFLVPVLLIGFSGIGFAPAPDAPDQVLPHLLMHLDLSPVLVGLFCAGALAASMSSGDAMVHACASILVRDGWRTGVGGALAPGAERRWIRFLVPLLMVAAWLLAVGYRGDLPTLLFIVYGPIVQFAPAVVATLYVRRATGAGVLAGLAAGIAVNVVLHLIPELRPAPLHAGLYGLAANVAVLALVSARGAPRDDAEERRFLGVAAGREGDRGRGLG